MSVRVGRAALVGMWTVRLCGRQGGDAGRPCDDHGASSLRNTGRHFRWGPFKTAKPPWLVWLSGLSTGLQTKGTPVQFPVRAHSWVVDQVPSRGCVRGNHTSMFLSLSFSIPFPFSKKIHK